MLKLLNNTLFLKYKIKEGKNLIYIVAESFNEIGVREDLTPTLYKLVNSGFVFENFYYESTIYSF